MLTQLNQLRDQIHANAVAKGFYEEIHPDEHYLALIIEEIGEAITADRKGQRANTEAFREEMERGYEIETPYKMYIKGSVEEELADIAIRLLDFAGHKGIDLTLTTRIAEAYQKEKDSGFYNVVPPASHIKLSVAMFNFTIALKDLIWEKENKGESIANQIFYLEALSHVLGFDLLYHVKAKMQYNATRPYKHGKAY